MFNFMRQGQVLVTGADEDELFEAAIDAGADDVQPVFDEEGQPTSNFKVRQPFMRGGEQGGGLAVTRG
jgi:transcriptional/translational regulatory protein YebC/TACO1